MLFWRITEDEQNKTIALAGSWRDAEIGRRRFTSDLLVNLARRNQSMLYRQLDIINQLEEPSATRTRSPSCSGSTTWPPGSGATPRACWCSPARSRPGSGASRSRCATSCAPPSPRPRTSTGSSFLVDERLAVARPRGHRPDPPAGRADRERGAVLPAATRRSPSGPGPTRAAAGGTSAHRRGLGRRDAARGPGGGQRAAGRPAGDRPVGLPAAGPARGRPAGRSATGSGSPSRRPPGSGITAVRAPAAGTVRRARPPEPSRPAEPARPADPAAARRTRPARRSPGLPGCDTGPRRPPASWSTPAPWPRPGQRSWGGRRRFPPRSPPGDPHLGRRPFLPGRPIRSQRPIRSHRPIRTRWPIRTHRPSQSPSQSPSQRQQRARPDPQPAPGWNGWWDGAPAPGVVLNRRSPQAHLAPELRRSDTPVVGVQVPDAARARDALSRYQASRQAALDGAPDRGGKLAGGWR